ncbi:epoxyqueuosine reductase QueH [Helicobacter salomonis]|uniref:epoxyqueuosine reductase QueH n=1 Tax=Helicobacter salomonis TaxID=56878 RepID=UPI000CF1B0B9|nr:epoxyqueuosine reductase QueH [Helicobacter salomonis]
MTCPKMLVHICCAVDSHFFLQELRQLYPQTQFTGFFYNPNIHPHEEYQLRLQDAKRSCKMLDMALIEGDYALDAWLQAIQGLEEEREKGARCNVCFDVRLEASAKMALMLGIEHFSTTLLSSPMKEQIILKSQGEAIGARYGLEFIYHNTRAKGGVERQNAMAKRDKLYRQNYCGCRFALNAQREAQDKPCIELMSPLNGQIHPAGIPRRLELFKRRDVLEAHAQGYELLQQSALSYLLLRAHVHLDQELLPSVILNRSTSKKVLIKDLRVQVITLEPTLAQKLLAKEHNLEVKPLTLEVGLSPKDDTLFLDMRGVSALLQIPPTSLSDLKLCYDQELYVRERLVGGESIQPLIIVQDLGIFRSAHPPVRVQIVAQFFEHKNFYLLEHPTPLLPPEYPKEQSKAHAREY